MAVQNIYVELAMFRRVGELSAEGQSLQQACINACEEMEEYYAKNIGKAVVRFSLPYQEEMDNEAN